MKTKAIIVFSLLCLTAVVSSCAHYAKMTDVQRVSQAPIPKVWLVGSIEINQRVSDPETEKRIPEILGLLAGKYHVTVVTDKALLKPGAPYALCHLWVREQPFNLSIDQYNSIAGLLTLTSPDSGETLARAVYSEETEESIRSFQRLFLVIDELFANLARTAGA